MTNALEARIAKAEPTNGIAGTAYRVGDRIEVAPKRAAIEDLDVLASPHDYFETHIVMTSRGCAWRCTFCGAETTCSAAVAAARDRVRRTERREHGGDPELRRDVQRSPHRRSN